MTNEDGFPPHEVQAPRPGGNSPNAPAIEAWLVAYIAEMLQVKPASIDIRRPFTYFGLSSTDGLILAGDLEKWLGGRRLAATLAWDFPTIETLARHLAGDKRAGDEASSAIGAAGNDAVEKILSEIERLPEEHEAPSLMAHQGTTKSVENE